MSWSEFSEVISMAGTVAFAVSAVLAVAYKGMNIFGASVLGIITAIGGGTIRDIILDVPVFWSYQLEFIWVAFFSSIVAFYARTLLERRFVNRLLAYVDGAGVALFAIAAVDKVWNLEFGIPVAPVILGVVTAIGGGLLRDVLAGRENLLMNKELYAIPVLLGCAIYVIILSHLPEFKAIGAIICISLIFSIRAAAIRWNLSVPDWLTIRG